MAEEDPDAYDSDEDEDIVGAEIPEVSDSQIPFDYDRNATPTPTPKEDPPTSQPLQAVVAPVEKPAPEAATAGTLSGYVF